MAIKKLLLITAVFLLIFASTAYAQLIPQQCTVRSVDVSNTISDTVTTKLLYRFECSAFTQYQGQITKMIIKVPYTGLRNIEAEDPFGPMKVLEGPEYIKSSESEGETVIGVMFRKGLLMTTENTVYSIAIKFDAPALVSQSESIYSIKPGELVNNVKITIVSTGITEMTIPVSNIDYVLNLPEGSGIQQVTPSVCGIAGGKVSCNNLDKEQFSQVEIKWTQAAGEGWSGKIQEYTKKYLPFASNLFKNAFSLVKKLITSGK